MMMTGPVLLATSWFIRSSTAFTAPATFRCASSSGLFSASSSNVMAEAWRSGISRLSTLQTLLSKYGAPGSQGCTERNDLTPTVVASQEETPELIGSLVGNDAEMLSLHPHLFPIAKSAKTGNYICALRRAYADDADYQSSTDAPWPIVEAIPGGPGMRLLALNSEHLMRRIACESDFAGEGDELVSVYNDGIGKGIVNDADLDVVYEAGSAEALGYGVERFVLLRVGPFPDLYESMANQHAARGDEQSAVIAAETCNGKFSGFGSTFLSQARLLKTLSQRDEEARDAARMCLRMPLPSIGLSREDLRDVAVLAELADENDREDDAIAKLGEMYEKIRAHEREEEDPAGTQGMTPEQAAFDEANYLMDQVALSGGKWSEIRPKLAEIYRSVKRDDMADFVNPKG